MSVLDGEREDCVERLDCLVDRAGRQWLYETTVLVTVWFAVLDGCLALLCLLDLVSAVVVDGFDVDVA